MQLDGVEDAVIAVPLCLPSLASLAIDDRAASGMERLTMYGLPPDWQFGVAAQTIGGRSKA